MFTVLLAVTSASTTRFFAPQPPAVQLAVQQYALPAAQPVAQQVVQPVYQPVFQPALQSEMYVVQPAQRTTPQEAIGWGLLCGVGVAVVSLAMYGGIPGRVSEPGLLEKRQMLIEEDEANAVQELRFVSAKLGLEAERQAVSSVSAEMAQLLQSRQLLMEEDEVNCIQELAIVEEKLRAEESLTLMNTLDAQLAAVRGRVTDAAQAVREIDNQAILAFKSSLKSGEEYAKQLPGALPIFGYFDPLGFTEGTTEDEVKRYREAELKHGRVGTLAAIGILASEAYHAVLGDAMNGVPAIFAFEDSQLFPLTLVMLTATAVASNPNLNPRLKPAYVTDPRVQSTELWHVRTGMLTAVGIIAKEVATGACLVCV